MKAASHCRVWLIAIVACAQDNILSDAKDLVRACFSVPAPLKQGAHVAALAAQ
jgi:hypothetical protein